MCRIINAHSRRDKGYAIVESVAGMVLIMGTLVVAALFLLNLTMIIGYKVKLAIVAQDIANYAVSLPIPSNEVWNHSYAANWWHTSPSYYDKWSQDAQAYGRAAVRNMGLPEPSSVTVHLETDTDDIYAMVTVKMGDLPLFGNGTYLSSKIFDLTDSAFSVAYYDQPPALLSVLPKNAVDSQPEICVPAYGLVDSLSFSGLQKRPVRMKPDAALLRPFYRPCKLFKIGLPSADSDSSDPSYDPQYQAEPRGQYQENTDVIGHGSTWVHSPSSY